MAGAHLATAVIAVAFVVATGWPNLRRGRHLDFLSFYTGGLLVRQGRFDQLYAYPAHVEIESKLAPENAVFQPYIRPPFYALLVSPLTLVSLPTAHTCWVALQVAVLLACWAWLARRFGSAALAWASVFLPPAVGLINGQDCIFVLALLILGFILWNRGREFTAGAVWGLAIFKPHILFLLPLLLIAFRKWRAAAGFGAVAGALAGISLALIGFGGLGDYLRLLRSNEATGSVADSRWMMVNIEALAGLLDYSVALRVLLSLAVVALVVAAGRRAPFERWFSAAIAGSLLLAPHVFKYDAAALLLPGIIGALKSPHRSTRIAAGFALSPLPYFFTEVSRWLAALGPMALIGFMCALAWEGLASIGRNPQYSPEETACKTE
ncbi:MAG: glycosyltransferase family 87 protein [Acidobacteriota bacterium]